MILRPYAPSDLPALAEIYCQAVRRIGPEAYAPNQVEIWAQYPDDAMAFGQQLEKGYTLLAVDGENAMAFGQLEPSDHLSLLYCHPDYARRGVASAIYHTLEARADALQVPILRTEASRISRHLFEKFGFTVIEVETVYRGGIAFERFQMEKQLELKTRNPSEIPPFQER